MSPPHPLRVAVDATALLGTRTGVGAVTHEIVSHLADRADVDLTVFALSWRGRGLLPAAAGSRARAVRRPMAARPLRELWKRANQPPIEWWTGPVDVAHGPNFVVPPTTRAAQIVTVHDLTCLHYPELCTRDTLEYPALIRRAIARGAWIHAVSEFVADEVRAAFTIDADRVVAITNGTTPLPDPPLRAPSGGQSSGQSSGGGSERYILGLGTIEPRKDFPSLVRAFDIVAADDPDVRLVIAGPNGWGAESFDAAVDAAHHRDRIVHLGWIPDDRRAALLRGASVFAFPSIYEGFGLPPLEAMSAGTPVVTTRAGALPDTVGDAALLVEVGDIDALAKALHAVLTDDTLAADLVRRGAERVTHFSWDGAIEALVRLYRQAAPHNRSKID